MKKVLTIVVMAVLVSACFGEEMIFLSGGTVVADRQDEGTGDYEWFGEAVTVLTIGADDVGEDEYIEISAKITGISDSLNCWVEIGLIPMERWDYWQEAYGGDYKSAVFDKGLYVVSWFVEDGMWALGATLQEGWNVGGGTVKVPGLDIYPLNRPTENNPWEFSISMYPDDSGGGEAYLWFDSGQIYGEEPFDFGYQEYNNNDYSQCYLIAQIWSLVPDAEFSFRHARARVMTIKDGSK
jgi:hypothetical protein